MNELDVKIKYLDRVCELRKGTKQSACYDASALLDVEIDSKAIKLVPLGFCLEMPVNIEAQIRGRSGFTKKGILVQFGTIDADYRGVVHAIVNNTRDTPITIQKGDRIAQVFFNLIPRINLVERFELTPTVRGEKGFGSTGEK